MVCNGNVYSMICKCGYDMMWYDVDIIIYRSYNDGTLVYGIYANILEYIYISEYTLDLKGYDHL
jgi:hypothetical protein